MATLTINGKNVTVDDSFKSLPPDQQEATVEEIAKSMNIASPAPSAAADVAKSAGIGAVKGAIGLAGMPTDFARLGVAGIDYLGRKGLNALGAPVDAKPFQDIYNDVSKVKTSLPGSGEIRRGVEGVTGKFYEPQTTPGKYAQTIGEFAPGAAMLAPKGVSMAQGLIRGAVVPGAASEAAGQATEGTAAEPWARVAGAALGAVAPSAAQKIATPNPISTDRQALVDVLKKEGVDLTAGQTTGNKPLRWAEAALSDMPGGGGTAAAIDEAQRRQFTAAALKRAGADSELATPDVMAAAKSKIGDSFNDLTSRNTLQYDPVLAQDMTKALKEYENVLPSQQKQIAQNYFDDIISQAPQMDGKMYQESRSRLTKQSDAIKNSDPALAGVLKGYRNALDQAMGRSISPTDQEAWSEARRQWGNFKVLEKASTGAGENAAQGTISPSALRNATVANNRAGYAVGNGDFAELARAGEALMKPLPQSGTAPRQHFQHIVSALSAGAGGAAGGVPGALAGAALPGLAGRALMSRPVQAYLSNQVAGGKLPAMTEANRLLMARVLIDHAQKPQ